MKEKDTEKQLKALEEAVRQEQETGGKTAKKHRESSSAAAKESHPLASFLIGLVLLGAGIFWVLNSFVVSFSWGSLWGGFGMNTSLATGLMLVPLLIGIGLLFFLDRKWIGWVVTAIGLLAILVTLLTSVRFRPVSASLWQYVVMFGMIAAGCGLVARGLLKSRDQGNAETGFVRCFLKKACGFAELHVFFVRMHGLPTMRNHAIIKKTV